MLSAFDANGRKPLPIEFDEYDQYTYQPVGENHTMFTRYIGNYIGNHIPMHYENWDSVPENLKMALLPSLEVNIYYYLFIIYSKYIF